MKKRYTVTTFILWDVKENYRKNTYIYKTKKDALKVFERISSDLETLLKNGTIKDFQIEL